MTNDPIDELVTPNPHQGGRGPNFCNTLITALKPYHPELLNLVCDKCRDRLHPIHKDSLDRTGPKSQKIEISVVFAFKPFWPRSSKQIFRMIINHYRTMDLWVDIRLTPHPRSGLGNVSSKARKFYHTISTRKPWDLHLISHRLIRQAGPEWPLLGYTPYESFSNFSLHLSNFFLDFHKNIFSNTERRTVFWQQCCAAFESLLTVKLVQCYIRVVESDRRPQVRTRWQLRRCSHCDDDGLDNILGAAAA